MAKKAELKQLLKSVRDLTKSLQETDPALGKYF